MDVVALVLVIAVLAVLVWFIGTPLLARTDTADVDAEHSARAADLDAAKTAKYAQIRELELDYRTGKLSETDFKAQDRQLRAEAVALLRARDELGEPRRPLPS